MEPSFLDPVSFAAGVWNLTPAQARELNAQLDCEPSEPTKLVAATRYIRRHVDAETLARTAARIRSGELRVPLYDPETETVIPGPVQ